MIIVKRDILSVTNGVIVHQVNCQSRIGAGVSGAIIKRYPIVESAYHSKFQNASPSSVFGTWQPVQVSESLIVVNAFAQFFYGNAAKTKRVYTDEDKLVKILTDVCNKYSEYEEIWIPYGIGCGLAGGNWENIVFRIERLPLNVAKL